jgi:integrase
MAKTTNLLNDLQLRRMLAAGVAIAKSDGDGLTFTLSKAGTASWVLRYRLPGGRRKEITLGNYPDLSLSGARESARALRVQIDKGQDPAADKRESKSREMQAWTVAELVTDYREKVLRPDAYAPVTIYYREADISKAVLPKLGSWQVTRLSSVDIVRILKESGRTWAMTKRLLTTISKLMDHACGLTIIAANPCAGIKMDAMLGKRPKAKTRTMLSVDDLRLLLKDIDAIGRENALALLVLLATCVRGVELVKAKKEDFDLDSGTWWVPDANVKTRSGFLVPLVPVVVEWVRELMSLSGESQYLLPARRADRKAKHGDTHVGRTTLWAGINRAFQRGDLDIQRFTPHDTRSTAKGHMRNMGISREISEIALNHKLKGMEGIYDVREEIPERRRALTLWADFLLSCETGAPPPTAKVVPLRRIA